MTKDVTPLELRAKAAASQACLLDLYEWENTVYKEDLAHRRAATAGAAAAFCPPRDARVVGSRSGATISIVVRERWNFGTECGGMFIFDGVYFGNRMQSTDKQTETTVIA